MRSKNSSRIAMLVAVAAALTLILAPSVASAGRDDGGFCIKATYTDGGQTGIKGAPACTAPVIAPNPQPTTPPAVVKEVETYQRLSVGTTGSPFKNGTKVAIKISDADSGLVYKEIDGTVSNGYLNTNSAIKTKTMSNDIRFPRLLIQMTVNGETYSFTLASDAGKRYKTSNQEMGFVYLTSRGLEHHMDNSTIKW